MKKLVFVLIALFCIFLVGCKEKQIDKKMYDMPVDNKINLNNNQNVDTLSYEQEENIEETLQIVEQKDNNLSASSSELNQVEVTSEGEESFATEKNNEVRENDELMIKRVSLADELKKEIGELYCEIFNEKHIPEEYKDDPVSIDDLRIGEYFGSYGVEDNIHVIYIFNIKYHQAIFGFLSFTYITINDSSEEEVTTYKFHNLTSDYIVLTADDIYSFQEACDNGLLTIADMDMIYEQYQLMEVEAKNGR